MTILKLRLLGWYRGSWYWFSIGLFGVTLTCSRGCFTVSSILNFHVEWANFEREWTL